MDEYISRDEHDMKERNRHQQSSNIQQGNGTINSPALLHGERDTQVWKDIAGPFGSHIASRTGLMTSWLRQHIYLASLNRRLPRLQVWRSDYPDPAITKWASKIASPIKSFAGHVYSKFKKTTPLGRKGDELKRIAQLQERGGYGSVQEEIEYPDEFGLSIPSEAIVSKYGEAGAPDFNQSRPRLNVQSRSFSGEYTPQKDKSTEKFWPAYLIHRTSSPTGELKSQDLYSEKGEDIPQPNRHHSRFPMFTPVKEEIGRHISILRRTQAQPDVRGQFRPPIKDYSHPEDIISASSKPPENKWHVKIKDRSFSDEYPYQGEVLGSTLTSPQGDTHIKAENQLLSGKYHSQKDISEINLRSEYKTQKILPYVSQSGLSDSHSEKASANTMSGNIIGSLLGRTKLDSQRTNPSIIGERAGVDRMSRVSSAMLPIAQKKSTEHIRRLSILPQMIKISRGIFRQDKLPPRIQEINALADWHNYMGHHARPTSETAIFEGVREGEIYQQADVTSPSSIFRLASDHPLHAINRQHIIDRDADRLSTKATETLPITLRALAAGHKSPSLAKPSLLGYTPSVDRLDRSLYRSPLEAGTEINTITEGIHQAGQVRPISPVQVPDERGIRDFKQIERDNTYRSGQSSSTREKTLPIHTLTSSTGSPMMQMAYPKWRASDVKPNPDTLDGSVFPKGSMAYDIAPAFLDRRMDENTMNIMPAGEASETQSTEQSVIVDIDIDSFAQKVYRILKRQMAIEKERYGVHF